ncbi:hypothetical protein ABT160_41360 [Streptomyces sp. NPDC001941]|uniref:hypothetical protein n=1 Tax=Streptomyces sp. NPDC001941 TaxID=3154659 RepID=UPI003334543A
MVHNSTTAAKWFPLRRLGEDRVAVTLHSDDLPMRRGNVRPTCKLNGRLTTERLPAGRLPRATRTQPAAGALVSRDLLRLIRDGATQVEPQNVAVAIDPSGGGRDTVGVIGGFLGADKRVWVTHDVSAAMSSADWSRAACRLAYETNATIMYVEWNFGRDMAVQALETSWETLQREGPIPESHLMPLIDPVRAKQGKLLRAEPVAQLMIQDRIRLRGAFVDLENEWATWQPTDPDSPGRIDASCILAYGLIPEANRGAIVHAPLPTAPVSSGGRQPPAAAGPYGRRIGK